MASLNKSVGSDTSVRLPVLTNEYTTHNGYGEFTDGGGTYPGPVQYAVKHGVAIPDFHKRLKAGELLPHTPYSTFELGTVVEPNGTLEWTARLKSDNSFYSSRRIDVYFDQHVAPKWFYTHEEFTALANDYDPSDLVQAAAAAVNNSGHDSLTFLAELSKVRRMFVDLVRKIARLDLPRNFRSASKQWLELRYGWRTLIFDLIELEAAVRSLDDLERTRVSERVGRGNQWTEESIDRTETTSNIHEIVYTDTWSVSERGSITADFNQVPFRGNVVLTAWELVPWSFVLDWIVQIGQLLASYSFLAQTGEYASSHGIRLSLNRKVEGYREWLDNATYSYTGPGAEFSSETVHSLKIRVPLPVSKLPQVSVNLDSFKVIDLIALLYNKFANS